MKPMEIEQRSFEIITELLGDRKLDPENAPVIKRAIHTTADFDYADGQLTVWLYIGLPADQVLPDQIQLYGVDADAMDYSLEPELASEASYLGDSQWRLTFPLPSDDLYYDGTLGLSFLDDQGVEENSFLIPVFLTT